MYDQNTSSDCELMIVKLDFEKYQQRVDTSRKKTKRSERDNAYLAKAEAELVRAKEVRFPGYEHKVVYP